MSINVTVTGNPVSINRGTMVTSGPDNNKKEYERRRLLRLEQVRQQSKELAEQVRDKVKKEKEKQIGKIEREGKEKLKNWQNRKLLELQNQYKDALDEIGLGHKNAVSVIDETSVCEEDLLEKRNKTKERTKTAATNLQIQKNEEKYRKAMPKQQKQLVRDIENTRAAIVSSLNKQKGYPEQKKTKVFKPSANINITIPEYSNSSEDQDFSSSSNKAEYGQCEGSENICESSESSVQNNLDTFNEERKHEQQFLWQDKKLERGGSKATQKKLQEIDNKQKLNKLPRSYLNTIGEQRDVIDSFRNRDSEISLDTRISDKIKQRKLMALEPDFCDFYNKLPSRHNQDKIGKSTSTDPLEISSDECLCTKITKSCPCKSKIYDNQQKLLTEKDQLSMNTTNTPGNNFIEKSDIHTCSDKNMVATADIPSKPAVKLRCANSYDKSAYSLEPHRISDTNKFEKQINSASQIEKITTDSIEVLPNSTSEAEWKKKIKQRDREAHIRGKNALEKEKIQKNYEEMIKYLPMLQKKEHIAQIGLDKAQYHMSQERLQQREDQRQTILENAYSKVLPELQPKIVTAPRRTHEIINSEEPFHILDGNDSRILNLGTWDVEAKPKAMFSTEEVQEIIKAFTIQKPEDRRLKLKHLLNSLKLQKKELLNEIRALPKDDSINALINDLQSFSDNEENIPKVRKRKKSRHQGLKIGKSYKETDVSNNSDVTGQFREHQQNNKGIKKKSHKDILILQNMSTQTTPKVTKDNFTSSSNSNVEIDKRITNSESLLKVNSNICKESHIPCDCNKEKVTDSSEELCKIFIKLHDVETPKVEVVRNTRISEGLSTEDPEVKNEINKNKSTVKYAEKEAISLSPKENKQISQEKPKSITDSLKNAEAKEEMGIGIETLRKARRIEGVKSSSARMKKKETVNKIRPRPENRKESWKEHLSKNSLSTSSTSYLSPPDFSRPNTTASTEISQQSLYNLRTKPQQTNIHDSRSVNLSHIENDQLINYIKKLLSMSKISIDELGVSSSEVQTPSQSIIETDSNNPLAALHNIVKFINFKARDVSRELSVSANETRVPPNSTISELDEMNILKGQSSSAENNTPISQTEENIISQYINITDSHCKRIANLAAMINKLREEKIKLLRKSPVTSGFLDESVMSDAKECPIVNTDPGENRESTPVCDKENSTRYLDFPPLREKSNGSNSSGSVDEEEFNRRLLDIDLSLAEKLKLFHQAQADKNKSDQAELVQETRSPSGDQPDYDFMLRLQRLVEENNDTEHSSLHLLQSQLQNSNGGNEVSFVPFLLDIPKLPILEPEPRDSTHSSFSVKKYPPPSKGLMTAKKFNGDISLIPHELSTIVEADSQMSTRISPNNSKSYTAPKKDIVSEIKVPRDIFNIDTDLHKLQFDECKLEERKDISTEEQSSKSKSTLLEKKTHQEPEKSVQFSSFKTLENSETSKSLSCNDLTCSSAWLSSNSTKKSSSSSSDMETIEAMLKSIGMDWAIPTLHKTQKALALSSSSSSGSIDMKKKNRTKSSSGSEISLKDFLKKQMLSKISSSSLKSDSSPASFIRELSEISAIVPHNSSADQTKRRTSTPVLTSKSTCKSKEDPQPFFIGTSDISSVRNTSCDSTTCKKVQDKPTFCTLDVNESSMTRSPL